MVLDSGTSLELEVTMTAGEVGLDFLDRVVKSNEMSPQYLRLIYF